MSYDDSADDLLSSILKEAAENEDGEFEFATFKIVDFIVVSLFTVIENTPKRIALVVKHLSENPHIIQELRVSMLKYKGVFVQQHMTNLNSYR